MEPSFLDTWTNLRDILLIEFIEQEQLKYVPSFFLYIRRKNNLNYREYFFLNETHNTRIKKQTYFSIFKSNPILIKGAEA